MSQLNNGQPIDKSKFIKVHKYMSKEMFDDLAKVMKKITSVNDGLTDIERAKAIHLAMKKRSADAALSLFVNYLDYEYETMEVSWDTKCITEEATRIREASKVKEVLDTAQDNFERQELGTLLNSTPKAVEVGEEIMIEENPTNYELGAKPISMLDQLLNAATMSDDVDAMKELTQLAIAKGATEEEVMECDNWSDVVEFIQSH